jgi:hypothetical protein
MTALAAFVAATKISLATANASGIAVSAALGQRRLDLDTARDQVQQTVTQAWGQLDAAKAQIESTQAQVAAAEIALNGVSEEARVGQRTTLDVLNAQQEPVIIFRSAINGSAFAGRTIRTPRPPANQEPAAIAKSLTTRHLSCLSGPSHRIACLGSGWGAIRCAMAFSSWPSTRSSNLRAKKSDEASKSSRS